MTSCMRVSDVINHTPTVTNIEGKLLECNSGDSPAENTDISCLLLLECDK